MQHHPVAKKLTRMSQLLISGCALPPTDMPSSPLHSTTRSCRMGFTVVEAPVMAMASVKPTMSMVKLRRMQDLWAATQVWEPIQ
jgi:hypothetical protein